jgi:hypothetical protein
MASTALALAEAAAKISNVGQMRAAMGAVTTTLSQGYAQLDSLTSVYGIQDTAKQLLDTVNTSANLLYNKYPDPALAAGAAGPSGDLQSLSLWDAHIAGQIVSEANDALKTVEQINGQNLFDIAAIVTSAVQTVGTTVGGGLQAVTNAVASGASAFVSAAWPTILIVGALAGVYIFRRQVIAAIGKL